MNSLRYLFAIAVLLLLSGGHQAAALADVDRTYLFLPDDLRQFDLAAYRFKTCKSGKQYVFPRARSPLNGLTTGYRTLLISGDGREIIYATKLNVQSSVDRARDQYYMVLRKV